jgi:hypothetical protein
VESLEHVAQAEEMPRMVLADRLERGSLIRFQDVPLEVDPELTLENPVKDVVELDILARANRNRQRNAHIVTNGDQDPRAILPHHPEGRVQNVTVDFIVL